MRSDAGAVLHTKALAMIKRLVLFGATGDLAGRFLLPALANVYDSGQLL
jgi:glucose-6-phosphate 1-dehydrogenase